MLSGEITFVYSEKLYKKSWVSYGKCIILKTLSFKGRNRVRGGLPWHDGHTSTNIYHVVRMVMTRNSVRSLRTNGTMQDIYQVTTICEHCSVFVALHRKIPWCSKPDFHNIITCSTCWSWRRSLGYRHTDAVKNSYFSWASCSVLQLAPLQAFSHSNVSRLITFWDSVVRSYRNGAARRCRRSFSDRI